MTGRSDKPTAEKAREFVEEQKDQQPGEAASPGGASGINPACRPVA